MEAGTKLAPARAKNVPGPFAFDPLRNLLRFNRAFENVFPYAPVWDEGLATTAWTPACDIFETDKELILKAELPEVKKEDLHLALENNVLTIKGERKFETETKEGEFHRLERSYGEFVRNFTLPNVIDQTKINAEFKDGLLRIVLPKREEAKAKQIEVKVK